VLELGSGPGFLAADLLRSVAVSEYVALDFSDAMHELAARRLGSLGLNVTFLRRSFRDSDWFEGLGSFDWVVTLQAVHELRHKAHAPALADQVLTVLKPGGRYLVADHYLGSDGMRDDQLYMTVDEQRAVLEAAGFEEVRSLLSKGGIVLHQGSKSNASVAPDARSQIA
jgi:SAM-dependent methyltransferase